MEAGAQYLLGEHDFKSFCMAASAEGKPTHRNVREISLPSRDGDGREPHVHQVVGNAFLHSMVRTIVGTLVMVGRASVTPIGGEVLEACDRRVAENAPAQGLVF